MFNHILDKLLKLKFIFFIIIIDESSLRSWEESTCQIMDMYMYLIGRNELKPRIPT